MEDLSKLVEEILPNPYKVPVIELCQELLTKALKDGRLFTKEQMLEGRAEALKNYQRILRGLMGNDIADEFSEKMAKGWDNLMKFMDEEEK